MNWNSYLSKAEIPLLILIAVLLVVLLLLLRKLNGLFNKLNKTLKTTESLKSKLDDISVKTKYISKVNDKVITKNVKNLFKGLVITNGLEKIFGNKKESKNIISSSVEVLNLINNLK